MIDEGCIGPDVDRSRISPQAQVCGASYLTGRRTRVAAGAVVRDSRLHDVVVEEGAAVLDSIIVAEGVPGSHKCDTAARTVVTGAEQPIVAAGARVQGCTLVNVSVGERSRLRDTWAQDCRFGPQNIVTDAKVILTETGARVRIVGPTEVSEAYVGHGAVLDRRGYLEGIFSNAFLQVRFDEAAGRLRVVGTIDLPHVSRYGENTINSTNSGKLLPQPDGVLRSLGGHVGLWHDELLSHEQIELGPCCWVVPWTKVIGQSPAPHATDDELVADAFTTYVMPFAVAGVDGQSTQGLVMPGELSTGLGPKRREGAWAFTYAPGAVIEMVRRLHEALKPKRKAVADTIVTEALRTALAMTQAMAHERRVDLSKPLADQRAGWPRWIATTHALLTAHLGGGLWEFADGEPVGWRREDGRWTHPEIGRVLAAAPDALERQVGEEEMFAFEDPVPAARVAVPSGAVAGSGGAPEIDPGAKVAPDAQVGPGCRIGAGTTIGSGAVVWNSVLNGCAVGAGAVIERSAVDGGSIGAGARVRSCRVVDSVLGNCTTADAASVAGSRLADRTRLSAFADVRDSDCDYATIIGGAFHAADVDVYLMSMHMAGGCRHLNAVPVPVELDGRRVDVPAIPMLGGGSLIRGTAERPVTMQGCFIGSNAILEPGCYLGFGCFILGTLGPDAGLPPFTLSTGGGPEHHQIGGVLVQMPSTIITHFINWTFQAVGPEGGAAVAEVARQSVEEGLRAVEWEVARRAGGTPDGPDYGARYRSLSAYTDAQLSAGVETYRRALDTGAWEIAFDGAELRFSSDKGRWLERGGSALWKPEG